MPKITKLTPQAKNPQRVNVFVDGEFYAGVDESVAWRLGLKPGMELTPELTTELVGQDEFARGWNYALRALKVSAQSVSRLTDKLTRRLKNPEMVDQIMARLKEADLINDQRLAESLIQKFSNLNNKSPREIRLVMMRRGIGSETIKRLTSNLSEIDTTPAIEKLAAAKLRQVKDLDTRVRFEKTAAYLTRKGFRYHEIKAILDKMLATPDF